MAYFRKDYSVGICSRSVIFLKLDSYYVNAIYSSISSLGVWILHADLLRGSILLADMFKASNLQARIVNTQLTSVIYTTMNADYFKLFYLYIFNSGLLLQCPKEAIAYPPPKYLL